MLVRHAESAANVAVKKFENENKHITDKKEYDLQFAKHQYEQWLPEIRDTFITEKGVQQA